MESQNQNCTYQGKQGLFKIISIGKNYLISVELGILPRKVKGLNQNKLFVPMLDICVNILHKYIPIFL